MKKAEIDEWVTALRSGEFHQGRGYLNRQGKYCCLGVKCELDVKADNRHNMRRQIATYADAMTYSVGNGRRVDAAPTPEMCEQWGLTRDQMNILIKMNDGIWQDTEKQNFNQIAFWIEQNITPEDNEYENR